MKVLVSGATGLVGRHLVPELLAAGHHVRAFLRPGREKALRNPDLTPYSGPPVEIATGDLKDFGSFAAALQGVQAVIHLGALPPTAPEEEMKAVNIYGTRELMLAAKKAHVRRVLHFSSAECSDNLVYSVFRDTKKASEKPVRGNNLEWTVFRPAPIYGPGDDRNVGPWLRKIAAGERFDIPGDGKVKVAPVHAADVAKAVKNTLEYGMAVDAVYHLAGPAVGYDEMLTTLGEIAGRAPKIRHFSLGLAQTWNSIQDLFARTPARKLALSTRRNDIRYFIRDHVYPTDDAAKQVGFSARPFAQGVKEACAGGWWKNGAA
ncbi:MAG TPA: NAD-dependent epimerase/dehydratase family protein [Planctomycetota bacterium]|nr:NAD-dependent epimerase/dehydratase family protein [Planctomycetota bacterium]